MECFEGVEKRIEFVFSPNTTSLRSISPRQLEYVLSFAQCNILSHRYSNTLDSYILSESSMFVYDTKIIIKTCGCTNLFNCFKELVKLTNSFNMTYIKYTRTNFKFPNNQPIPHNAFQNEIFFLDNMFGKGHGKLLNDEHFYVYENLLHSSCIKGFHLEICMTDLDTKCLFPYWYDNNNGNSKWCLEQSGINLLINVWNDDKNVIIHDHVFHPCGYSINVLHKSRYLTIHVTPQEIHSYASVEIYSPNKCVENTHINIVKMCHQIFNPKQIVIYSDHYKT